MLTKLTIRNFKRFEDVEIELDNPVVFIGPNNSGKTSAMQALALWDTGLKRWNEKRLGKAVSGKRRRGAAVNRRDIPAGPVPGAARHRQTRRPGAAPASPAAGVLAAFDAQASAATDKIFANCRESRALAALRDILLPKLMSGKLRASCVSTENDDGR